MNGMIIGPANSSREVLVIETGAHAYELIGRTKIGTFKWTGGCEYKGNGYGFPRKENSLLEIDICNRSVKEIYLNTRYRGEHHYGGVVTSDGILYQPPRNTDHILRIDLNNYETRKIYIPGGKSHYRYSSSVMLPSGDIYMIPEFGCRMLVLNTATEKVELFGKTSDHMVFGTVVGIDGCIYGYSKEGKGILKLDPATREADFICQNIGNPNCYGAVVGINGKIYGVPADGQIIWEFDVAKQTAKQLFHIDENGYAKCAGGGVSNDGTIAMMPCFGKYIYLMENDRTDSSVVGKLDNRFFNTSF